MSDTTATKSARRGQAAAGIATAVMVFAVLIVVFLLTRSDGDDSAAAPASQTSSAPVNPLTVEPEVTKGTGTLDKLAVTELIPGTGPEVKAGQTITVNYKLISYSTGDPIDSSWTTKAPFSTRIGTGELIKGWDQGIPGQKVGSRIQLDVPADLAYGPQRGDLRFVVDILEAK